MFPAARRRGAAAQALGLSLILGSLILGSLILGILGLGSSASAEGPSLVSGRTPESVTAAVFSGYVFADASGVLPDRVRALGPRGAVCGSAEVTHINEVVGFYALTVFSSDQKRGCPGPGGIVQFVLLAGRVDDGVWAGQVGTLVDDARVSLNLQAAQPGAGSWLSDGVIEKDSWLRWVGAPVTLASALASLPLQADGLYLLDAESGSFTVTPALDVELSSGDLLLVRFRQPSSR